MKGLFQRFLALPRGAAGVLREIIAAYRFGDWKTRVSFTVMGFGSFARGQWLRGLLFFAFQTAFNLYLWFFGLPSLMKLPTLGTAETARQGRLTVYGDNSFLILLYGVTTILLALAYGYTWYINIRQNRIAQEILRSGGRLRSARDDLSALADEQFHKTLLALPALGVTLFTILPIFFMVLIAFTNYDHQHQPPHKLFTWVGLENFRTLLSPGGQRLEVSAQDQEDGTVLLTITARDGDIFTVTTAQRDAAHAAAALAQSSDADVAVEQTGRDDFRLTFTGSKGPAVTLQGGSWRYIAQPSFARTFRQVLLWTLVWACFATFLNYFLGMLVAMLINRRGVRLKKMWRTFLVMTIAVPQFVSLLYVSRLFAADGLVNALLMRWGWITQPLPFWTDASWARVTLIAVNLWVGVPYVMLIATGILMNIPAGLYEAARIDGASAFQTYTRITLPYMLFITGPYLLTSFTGNINNFNVIFLLSGGKPLGMDLAGSAGHTDLLITWLYKMTVTDSNYKLAAVTGLAVFAVCAVINLAVYNMIPSVRNEEEFQS